jgi:hypothetical protein
MTKKKWFVYASRVLFVLFLVFTSITAFIYGVTDQFILNKPATRINMYYLSEEVSNYWKPAITVITYETDSVLAKKSINDPYRREEYRRARLKTEKTAHKIASYRDQILLQVKIEDLTARELTIMSNASYILEEVESRK